MLKQDKNDVNSKYQDVNKYVKVSNGNFVFVAEDGYGDGLREADAGYNPGLI